MRHRKTPRWVQTVMSAQGQPRMPQDKKMRDNLRETPFPLPPAEGALDRFPDKAPWTTPIFEMSNWWLVVECKCGQKQVPLRLMSAQIGWRITLREIVPFLRCSTCRQRPTNVQLVDNPTGDIGRFGAKTKRLQLHP